MTAPARTIAPQTLTLLVGGVLLAHLFLLQTSAQHWQGSKPALQHAFITRTIAIRPMVAPAPETPSMVRKPVHRPGTPQPAPPTPHASVAPQESLPPAPISESVPDPASAEETPVLSGPAQTEDVSTTAETLPSVQAEMPASQAYNIPGSVRLIYELNGEVKKLSYSARAELLWLHDGQNYDARLEISVFLLGSRVQTSRGRITPQGLEPKRFSDKTRSELATHFERDKGKIIFSANTPQAPLLAGVQDRLSVFLQLAAMIAADPAKFPAATTITLPTAGTREASLWLFNVDGEEPLELPGGRHATLKLTHQPGKLYEQKVELWLAPALSYLPARIRLSQSNGDFIDQQWISSEAP